MLPWVCKLLAVVLAGSTLVGWEAEWAEHTGTQVVEAGHNAAVGEELETHIEDMMMLAVCTDHSAHGSLE